MGLGTYVTPGTKKHPQLGVEEMRPLAPVLRVVEESSDFSRLSAPVLKSLLWTTLQSQSKIPSGR